MKRRSGHQGGEEPCPSAGEGAELGPTGDGGGGEDQRVGVEAARGGGKGDAAAHGVADDDERCVGVAGAQGGGDGGEVFGQRLWAGPLFARWVGPEAALVVGVSCDAPCGPVSGGALERAFGEVAEAVQREDDRLGPAFRGPCGECEVGGAVGDLLRLDPGAVEGDGGAQGAAGAGGEEHQQEGEGEAGHSRDQSAADGAWQGAKARGARGPASVRGVSRPCAD